VRFKVSLQSAPDEANIYFGIANTVLLMDGASEKNVTITERKQRRSERVAKREDYALSKHCNCDQRQQTNRERHNHTNVTSI
jgi:hypothetical protein